MLATGFPPDSARWVEWQLVKLPGLDRVHGFWIRTDVMMDTETYNMVLRPSHNGTGKLAIVPALPGCVSVGSTKEEALQLIDTIREARKTLPTHYRVPVSKS